MPKVPDLDSDNQSESNSDVSEQEQEQSTREHFHKLGITDSDIDEDRKRLAEEEKLSRKAKEKFVRFKPTKIIGFNSARVDLLYKDDKGRTIAYQQWTKKKPNREFIKLNPKTKRNPDKLLLASEGKYPDNKQIYTYNNNDSYVYISKGVDFIQLDMDEFWSMVLQVMGSGVTNPKLMEKMINSDFRLQYMSKSKLPHLKLKDWSKERRLIHITPEDLDKTFNETIQEKKDERNNLH